MGKNSRGKLTRVKFEITENYLIARLTYERIADFATAARYYELFPGYFARRVWQEGIWIPFTAVPEIEGWADFGIAFHETSHEGRTRLDGRSVSVAEADRTIGVTSFQYTEPWDIQLPFDPPWCASPPALNWRKSRKISPGGLYFWFVISRNQVK